MVTCQASLVLISLLMALVVGGCAAQSATNDPAAIATFDGTAMASRQADGTGGMSQSYGRPRLSEFVAHGELRDVHFDFDSYEIRPAEMTRLDASLSWLKSHPDAFLVIEGHADERGTNEYNVALGERRARASMTYLVSRGVPASRITVLSYGEERAVCRDKTEHCWSRNRRAHFLVKAR